jgi:hypothetical protein
VLVAPHEQPEVDIVAADRVPARKISFVGSVKWHERTPFDMRDLAALARDALAVPGADDRTQLVAVSRSGFKADGVAASYGPDELMGAWAPR